MAHIVVYLLSNMTKLSYVLRMSSRMPERHVAIHASA